MTKLGKVSQQTQAKPNKLIDESTQVRFYPV
jgi:hypothetical protein